MARILITGATGFIGRRLVCALHGAGHDIVCVVRRAVKPVPDAWTLIEVDYARDHDPASWVPRLRGIDVVINAVGILRERGENTFDAVHAKAPRALFEACTAVGVDYVVQISALGADAQAMSGYHQSKHRADTFLERLPIPWVIVQPSLVYGADGTSARLFTALAGAPLTPLPGKGDQRVQPIYVDDLIEAIRRLVETRSHAHERVALVGPEPLSLRELLARLRRSLDMGNARFVPVPLALVRLAASIGQRLPNSLLDSETLSMLQRGNTADPGVTASLLGRMPRPVERFVEPEQRRAARVMATLGWLLPLMRFAIAAVWIATGLLSFGIYPVHESYALLSRVGIDDRAAPLFLYGAATLDVMLGIGTLLLARRQWLWLAQIGAILFYTALITWKLPEFWLHPYGPILKNFPMLAAIGLLYELEKR
jgi:uncharacterized protein YbjT (DUF2867 family)